MKYGMSWHSKIEVQNNTMWFTTVVFFQDYLSPALNIQAGSDLILTSIVLNTCFSVVGIVLSLGTFILMLHKDLRTNTANKYMATLSFIYFIQYINKLIIVISYTEDGRC